MRTLIGGCLADPHIFDATIRDNLRLGRAGASDTELADAANRARLLPWIDSLPLRWDTPVGPHGAAMAGGERQRLALARALLADPAVLILDEPTAHLDPEARAALTADVLAVTAGRATLLITHELEGLEPGRRDHRRRPWSGGPAGYARTAGAQDRRALPADPGTRRRSGLRRPSPERPRRPRRQYDAGRGSAKRASGSVG